MLQNRNGATAAKVVIAQTVGEILHSSNIRRRTAARKKIQNKKGRVFCVRAIGPRLLILYQRRHKNKPHHLGQTPSADRNCNFFRKTNLTKNYTHKSGKTRDVCDETNARRNVNKMRGPHFNHIRP